MRRLLILFCILMIAALPANAENAPVINGPSVFEYDKALSGMTSELLDLVIDLANDETRTVETYGAVRIEMQILEADGSSPFALYMTLANTPCGHAIITEPSDRSCVFYDFKGISILCLDGKFSFEETAPENFEGLWSGMYFPYVHNGTYYASGRDEDGHIAFRIRGTDASYGVEGEFEHLLNAETMRLERTAAYIPDSNGKLYQYTDITYTLESAPELPDAVLELLSQNR